MSALEVLYHNVKIVDTDVAGTKILNTKQKYCDDDITINFSGGGSGIFKTWDLINASDSGTGYRTVVNDDSWLLSHRTDPNLFIAVISNGNIDLSFPISGSRMIFALGANFNLWLSSRTGSRPQYAASRSSSTGQTFAPTSNLFTPSTTAGHLYITTEGALQIYQTNSFLFNSTYSFKVIAILI